MTATTKTKKIDRSRQKNSAGFSLPELMVSSMILAGVVTMSAKLSNSTTEGMRKNDLRSRADSAMSLRMEEIRHCAFFYLISEELKSNPTESDCRSLRLNMAEQLHYPDPTSATSFTSQCNASTLGNGLQAFLRTNTKDLTTSFNLTDYDSTATSVPITTTITSNGNQIRVYLTASSIPESLDTIVVPHAQGWCR